MYCYPKGTDVIIYGSDNSLTRKLILEYRNYYNIHYIAEHLNPVKENETIFDVPVHQVGKEFYAQKCEYKIIVAYGVPDSCTVFRKNNFVPVTDYIPFWLLEYEDIDYIRIIEWLGEEYLEDTIRTLLQGKKGVILHGNCQTRIIDIYLKSNAFFESKYVIVKIPRIFEFDEKKTNAVQSRSLWNNIHIFIHHHIKDTNKFGFLVSSEHLKQLLPSGAVNICISNLWFSGYFPQYTPNSRNKLKEIQQSGLFPNGDSNLDKMSDQGLSIEAITQKVLDPHFYNRKTLLKYVDDSFKSLEEREKVCDVKMVDFLKKEYRRHLLFHSPNHPTHFVMKELTRRILVCLGTNDTSFRHEWWCGLIWNLRGQDMPIYPSVIKGLHLHLPVRDIKDMVYFTNNSIDPQPHTLEEWVKIYLKTCHSDKFPR